MSSSASTSSVVLDRYAGALVDLAYENKVLKEVDNDLVEMLSMLSSSDEFRVAVSSINLSSPQQQAFMSEICEKAKFHRLTCDFIGVLIQNRRLYALEGVIRSFQKMVAAREGYKEVVVETAEKLTQAQQKDIQKQLESEVGSGVVLHTKVNPEIIGGMIVTIGSHMIDDSVRRKLERLRVSLGANENKSVNQNLKEVG